MNYFCREPCHQRYTAICVVVLAKKEQIDSVNVTHHIYHALLKCTNLCKLQTCDNQPQETAMS